MLIKDYLFVMILLFLFVYTGLGMTQNRDGMSCNSKITNVNFSVHEFEQDETENE